MAEQTIPEPPDGAWVVVGDDPHVLLIRDDYSASESGYEPDVTWFLAHDGSEHPLSWAQVTGAEDDQGRRLVADGHIVQRVYTQDELDKTVAEAVAKVAARPVGDHLREAGGHCGYCGHQHSPTEWARLEDRLAEEADRG